MKGVGWKDEELVVVVDHGTYGVNGITALFGPVGWRSCGAGFEAVEDVWGENGREVCRIHTVAGERLAIFGITRVLGPLRDGRKEFEEGEESVAIGRWEELDKVSKGFELQSPIANSLSKKERVIKVATEEGFG